MITYSNQKACWLKKIILKPHRTFIPYIKLNIFKDEREYIKILDEREYIKNIVLVLFIECIYRMIITLANYLEIYFLSKTKTRTTV